MVLVVVRLLGNLDRSDKGGPSLFVRIAKLSYSILADMVPARCHGGAGRSSKPPVRDSISLDYASLLKLSEKCGMNAAALTSV